MGATGRNATPKARKGRAEVGLDNALVERRDIGAASRAALRVLAHGVDLAEAARDPEQIATIGRVYVDALERHRLTPTEVREGDAFERLLADLGRATPGASNPADT
jgi:hypothetical protein